MEDFALVVGFPDEGDEVLIEDEREARGEDFDDLGSLGVDVREEVLVAADEGVAGVEGGH